MHPQRTEFRVASFADLTTHLLHDLLRLRVDVFVVEQECAYPEIDGRDTEPGARHLWLARDGVPVAYLRILADPGGVAGPIGVERVGRVAVAKHARGEGHADRLMTEALAIVGNRPCVLDAQSYLVDFYARYGFTVAGPEYVEDGIRHVPMRRNHG
jgi:ElaA protein